MVQQPPANSGTAKSSLPAKNVDNSEPPQQKGKTSFGQKIRNLFSKKEKEEDDSIEIKFSKEEIEQARKKMEAELGQKLIQIRSSKSQQTPPAEDNPNPNKPEKAKNQLPKPGVQSSQQPSQPINGSRFLPSVKGTQLQQILDSLDKKSYDSTVRKISAVNFGSLDEFVSSLISELASFLEDYYNDLSYRLSQLRKEGVDAEDIGYRIMTVPLKINVFKSTGLKKDFDKARALLDGIKPPIDAVEKQLNDRKEQIRQAEEAAQKAQQAQAAAQQQAQQKAAQQTTAVKPTAQQGKVPVQQVLPQQQAPAKNPVPNVAQITPTTIQKTPIKKIKPVVKKKISRTVTKKKR